MRLGLFAINYNTCADPASAVRVARAAEAAGFESVWTGEHLVLPSPRTKASPLPPEAPMLDTVVAATWIAAHTSTIRIGTGIIVLPLRHPVVLAKELASVDVVSEGRLIVGVGAGYLEEEFAAVGVPLSERGTRMDEYVAAMRALWAMEQPSFSGRHVTFDRVDAHPRPRQQPSPPIVFGGGSPAAFRRAVTTGHGWYGFGLDIDRARAGLEALRLAEQRYERPDELGKVATYVTPAGDQSQDMIRRYEDLGIDCVIVLPAERSRDDRHRPVMVDDILRTIDTLADSR